MPARPPVRIVRPIVALAAAWAAFDAAPAMAACTVTTPIAVDLGSASPAALKAAAPPSVRGSGGFSCAASVLTLLGGNYLRATVAAGAVLKLASTTTSDTVNYTLAADAAGTYPIVPGTPRVYISGSAINLIGLLGINSTDIPVYTKPSAATVIAPGTYKGSVTITWDWYFCSLIGAGNVCIGTVDTGSRPARLDFTLIVAARPVTMTIAATTTWDPQSSTSYPKAIPGSRQRTRITVVNPDIVPIDLNSIALVLPTANRATIALDGDGTGSGSVVQMTEGTTPSTLTLAYTAPSSTTDDVDFSSNGGVDWAYAPVAGNLTSENAVTQVRFRPRGTMAASSSFSVSVPYLVR